jgi:hypothetical protein
MRRISNQGAAFGVLLSAAVLAGGCGAESQPALPQSPQELQSLAQQEDTSVHDLESKRTE